MRRDLDSICSARFRWSVVCSAMTTNDATNQHSTGKQRRDEAKLNKLRLVQYAEAELSDRLFHLLEGGDSPLAIETTFNSIDQAVNTTLNLAYGGPTCWIEFDHYLHRAWFFTTTPDYKDGQSKEIRVELNEDQVVELRSIFWFPRISLSRSCSFCGESRSSEYFSPGKNGVPF